LLMSTRRKEWKIDYCLFQESKPATTNILHRPGPLQHLIVV
jgi:hypothetical protein